MIRIDIPGFRNLSIEHLVLDFDGTLARNGRLLPGIHDRFWSLDQQLKIHVLTGDTFGAAREALNGLPVNLTVIDAEGQARAKLAYVRTLGLDHVVAIGNGGNDHLMLKAAALSMTVSGSEGTAVEALLASQIYFPAIHDALDTLECTLRLVATLRK
jgi:soluble P-type ATPase